MGIISLSCKKEIINKYYAVIILLHSISVSDIFGIGVRDGDDAESWVSSRYPARGGQTVRLL